MLPNHKRDTHTPLYPCLANRKGTPSPPSAYMYMLLNYNQTTYYSVAMALTCVHCTHHVVPTMLYPLQNSQTPLHLATSPRRGGHTECVEHLISAPGVDVNIEDGVSWYIAHIHVYMHMWALSQNVPCMLNSVPYAIPSMVILHYTTLQREVILLVWNISFLLLVLLWILHSTNFSGWNQDHT